MKIKTGPFDMTELYTAVQHMNNDKDAGLNGYGIEMEEGAVHGNGDGNVQ